MKMRRSQVPEGITFMESVEGMWEGSSDPDPVVIVSAEDIAERDT